MFEFFVYLGFKGRFGQKGGSTLDLLVCSPTRVLLPLKWAVAASSNEAMLLFFHSCRGCAFFTRRDQRFQLSNKFQVGSFSPFSTQPPFLF